jgi:uncharacterized protein (DUF1499 family)
MSGKVSMLMAATLVLAGFSSTGAVNQDGKNGHFAPCPGSPNCVSTEARDDIHTIAPISYSTDMENAKAKLIGVIRSMPRSKIVSERINYISAEFTSAIFRFVDDVEFFIDDDSKTIQFRSASRVGYSDMGVNRKRMEEIRKRFYLK